MRCIWCEKREGTESITDEEGNEHFICVICENSVHWELCDPERYDSQLDDQAQQLKGGTCDT